MEKSREIAEGRDVRLTRLEDLSGFQIAEGDPDIRGWEVRGPDDRKFGKVEELIVDPVERRVRYMEVKVDHALGVAEDRHILIPIGTARLREAGHDVLLERLPARGLTGAPSYKPGPITRDYETALREYYGATTAAISGDYYRDELYDDRHLRTRKEDTRDAVRTSTQPRLGDNEVTVPLTGDQEVIVRRPGSDEEILIKKKRRGEEEVRDR